MRELPSLEQRMIARGLDPSQFVISKDRATPATVPVIGPFFYDYTVFFGDEHFTVTEPNDMLFLDYLRQRGRGATTTAVALAPADPALSSLDGAADLRCAA